MKLNCGFMENYSYMKIDKIQNKKEISEQLQYELDMRAEEGNKYFDNNEYDKALEIWEKALDLIQNLRKYLVKQYGF